MPERERLEARGIAAALAQHAESIAADVLGPPTMRRGYERRWGRKGSLKLEVAGPWRGRWQCFDPGDPAFGASPRHGDMLDFVRLGLRLASLPDAIHWAQVRLGRDRVCPIAPATRKPPAPALDRALTMPDSDQGRRIAIALRIWEAAQPLPGSPAEKYLQGRGLIELPETVGEVLRFHPHCPRGAGPAAEYLPALVGLLHDVRSNHPCGIRRIFLARDSANRWCKIEDGAEKMALGRKAGAAVKLTPDEDVTLGLCIAEGIENALSLICEGLAPVWACGDADNVRTLPVLPGIEFLTVLADRDLAGLHAARTCATRWAEAGSRARVQPPNEVKDWNDALLRERAA